MNSPEHPPVDSASPLARLRQFGQSVWLDYISRQLIDSGALENLVEQDGLGGLTSNPSIFHKAIEGSRDYEPLIARLARNRDLSAQQLFEKLAVRDIQDAAQVLSKVYRQTQGVDGYVSLEVPPDVADDTRASIDAALRLWRAVDRPNVMIKIPGTAQGLPAIAELLAHGVNINITLLFARSTYEQVAEIYLQALDYRAARGEPIHQLASVASFFVSRIDTAVDQRLASEAERRGAGERERLLSLQGKVAIANAKLAYQSFMRKFSGPRWEALKAKGALPQRVLWASTGTKNPRYSDVLYVEELIGPQTVNTMPLETLAAFRDHGRPRATLQAGVSEAERVLAELEQLGISLDSVTDELLREGVRKFAEPYAQLLGAIERRRQAAPAQG